MGHTIDHSSKEIELTLRFLLDQSEHHSKVDCMASCSVNLMRHSFDEHSDDFLHHEGVSFHDLDEETHLTLHLGCWF